MNEMKRAIGAGMISIVIAIILTFITIDLGKPFFKICFILFAQQLTYWGILSLTSYKDE